MRSKLLVLLLSLISCCVLACSVTVSAEESINFARFKELALDSTVNEIILTENLDLNGETVTFTRNITLKGAGYKITNGSIIIDKGEGSFISDLTIENSPSSAIIIIDSANVKLQNVTVRGSVDYAVLCRTVTENYRTTLSLNLNYVSENNGKGSIMLEGQSVFTLKGSTATLNVNDYVFIQEAKDQAYFPNGEYRDKNYDKQDKLNVFCMTSIGGFAKRDTDKINQINFTKDDTAYKCYVIPYDESVPEVGVVKAPSTAVVGEPLDLKTAIEVKDNKSTENEMFIRYTVTDVNGQVLALTGQTEVFVNGSVLTPTQKGKLSIKVEVSDEYGNSTQRYIYIEAVPANVTKPVISTAYISRTQKTGKEIELPAFMATDFEGNSISVKTQVVDTENNTHDITNGKYTFEKEGSYCIILSAEDRYGNLTTKKFFVAAVNENQTVYESVPIKSSLPIGVVLFIVASVIALCLGCTNTVMEYVRKK